MSDGDDKLRQRYRELGREEPPAALDAAIVASARRAVEAPRARRQWAMPVSLAAVLVLAVGVTLRMQQEQPGVETAVPLNEYSAPPAAETAPAATPTQPAPPTSSTAPSAAPKAAAERAFKDQRDANARRDTAAPQARLQKPVDKVSAPPDLAPRIEPQAFPSAPAPAAASGGLAPPQAPQAAPQTGATTQSAPASAPAPAAQSAPLRAKREAAGIAADVAKETTAGPLERELERIAKLRGEGRHAEADEALERFRRENPAYRIPDAMWERVKPPRR